MVTAFYLDASVAVRALLGHSEAAAAWLEAADRREEDEVISSRILRTEITRVLRRENLPVVDRDQLLDGVSFVPLTEGVLQTAEAIGPHIKTIDAIHLASALVTGLDPTVVSHDKTMKSVAAELGLRVLDPVS